MAEKARQLVQGSYRVPAQKIDAIPHEVPEVGFVGPDEAKAEFGFADRTVILTFGLLTPKRHRGQDRRHAGDPGGPS